MTSELSKRTHSLISVMIALLLLVVIYFAIIQPLTAKKTILDTQIKTKLNQLVKFKAIAEEQSEVKISLEKIQSELKNSKSFIRSENSSLAVAELQEIIKSIIQKNNGTLTSIQDIATNHSEDTRSVHLKVIMTGEITSLKDILYLLATNQPLIFIDKLDIQKSPSSLPRNSRLLKPDNNLQISFEASAYLMGVKK